MPVDRDGCCSLKEKDFLDKHGTRALQPWIPKGITYLKDILRNDPDFVTNFVEREEDEGGKVGGTHEADEISR